MGGYFFDSVGDLGLVADVTRVERRVMMALNDVKYGHWITARDQSLYDMPTEETAAADDEESVALWGGHESREQEIYFEYRLTISRLNLRDHVTTWILRISNPNTRSSYTASHAAHQVLSRAETATAREPGHRR